MFLEVLLARELERKKGDLIDGLKVFLGIGVEIKCWSCRNVRILVMYCEKEVGLEKFWKIMAHNLSKILMVSVLVSTDILK
jgi:hypothetical protein